MKREFLKSIGLTDDNIINQIMAENGEDINRHRSDAVKARADLQEVQTRLSEVEKELDDEKAKTSNSEDLQKQLKDLQTKYDTDTKNLQEQIDKRNYIDAISKAIDDSKLKFSSKGAETAFRNALAEKGLKLTDGKLEGFDDFVKEQKASDPESFASNRPAPKFSGPVGGGGAPDKIPPNVKLAQEIGKAKASTAKASLDVFSMYAGGNTATPAKD